MTQPVYGRACRTLPNLCRSSLSPVFRLRPPSRGLERVSPVHWLPACRPRYRQPRPRPTRDARRSPCRRCSPLRTEDRRRVTSRWGKEEKWPRSSKRRRRFPRRLQTSVLSGSTGTGQSEILLPQPLPERASRAHANPSAPPVQRPAEPHELDPTTKMAHLFGWNYLLRARVVRPSRAFQTSRATGS